MNPSTKVLFEPIGRKIDAYPDETILEAAKRAGVGLRSECGGAQTCGKCRIIVQISEGSTTPTNREKQILSDEELSQGYRLACVMRVSPNIDKLTIQLPHTSLIRKRRFLESGIESNVKLDPAFKKLILTISKPTILDRRSDEERLIQGINESYGLSNIQIDQYVLGDLPSHLYSEKTVTAVVWGDSQLISLEDGDTSKTQYALAIDVGTSRITCSLFDILSGRRVARRSLENPQIVYGEDVMTRVTFSQSSAKNRGLLQKIVLECINHLINSLCADSQTSPSYIYEAIVVGNTVMHHMLLGIETRRLAMSPFEPVTKRMMTVKSRDLGLNINFGGMVSLLPIVDVFVGADAVGDILSTGLNRCRKPPILLDVGTNTEVMLSAGGVVYACSCASGPAFEGVHIEHGMKAVTGAIEGLSISEGASNVKIKVIGGGKPVGICGSGVVDALAQLLKRGVVNKVGRINTQFETKRLKKIGGTNKFVLAFAEESGTGRDITISEKDIMEVILAKAAIYSACATLMKVEKLDACDINKVLIAGAFGNHLGKGSAKTIGLIPDVDNDKILFVGNSALAGAEIALKSHRKRLTTEKISRCTKYLELAISKDFELEYTNALWLPHRDPSRFS